LGSRGINPATERVKIPANGSITSFLGDKSNL